MKRHLTRSILLAIGISILAGCAGYDRILFATKTNIGLDIDDQPPTAEITIARRELAITPTFQDTTTSENTLPLLASFGLTGNFLNPEITSRFAGGEAAVVLAQGPKEQPSLYETSGASSICLSKEPDTRPWLKKKWHSLVGRERENTRAFYFATDTAFGLKAAWDGTTGPYPSTVKLGYNRKELAFPPIYATPAPSGCTSPPAPSNAPTELSSDSEYKGPWRVTVSSFVASLDNSSAINDGWEWVTGKGQTKDEKRANKDEEGTKNGVTHIQFFATGKAASEFVKRREVNAAMNKAMYQHTEQSSGPAANEADKTSPR